MKVLKITSGEWINASRDKRELTVLREMGADVSVMAKGKPGDNFLKDNVDGFEVFRFSTRPLGSIKFLNPLNRFLSLFIWAYKAKKFKADIISGHDLFPLFIAWLSNIGRKNKAKLVYDSHEFELGRNSNNGILYFWFVKHLERFMIKRCIFSIMVNDSIADEVKKIHKLDKRPIVVRNIPSYWEIDPNECLRIKEMYYNSLNLPNDFFICMYHGGLLRNRGIEELIEVISKTEKTAGVILGNGDTEYVEELKEIIQQHNVENRIFFHKEVHIEHLWKFVGAVDCGIIVPRIIAKSYFYGLGNKFFENIQSEVPIICNNTPEMARIIKKYNIGITIDPPSNVEKTVEAVKRLQSDIRLYDLYKLNLVKAKEELCWENEKDILVNAYKNIL